MLEYIRQGAKFLYDRATRKRLRGLRPVVICLVKCVESENFLLVQPRGDTSVWIPPQEGIDPNDDIEGAALRGLQEELGLLANMLQFRRSVWLADRIFPQTRRAERNVPFSPVKMRGKSYWAALVLTTSEHELVANPSEIAETAWVTPAEVRASLASNQVDKRRILEAAFKQLADVDISGPS